MSMCSDCDGKGFREYDAGLVQIGCKTCEMTGKVDCELTKEEFEIAYAFRSDMTPDQVAELGLVATLSDCLEGWAMQKAEIVKEVTRNICAIQATNRQALIDTINALVDSSHLKGTDGKPYLHIELDDKQLGCAGCSVDYATEADVPYHSVPCTCGNPKHWLIKYEEVIDDSYSGTRPIDKSPRSPDTSQSKQSPKPKAKRKARKKSS